MARWLEVRFFRRLLRSVSVQLRATGQIAEGPGTLYVANHISWADIPVLASVLDAAFVAKAEAGNWPLIGPLMRRYGVVLVDRNSRGTSSMQVDAIAQRLMAGQSVIIFPEGTTSNGEALLPFRSSLMQAARHASAVQPVVLRYLEPDGQALSAARQRDVAWIGDDTLADGIVRMMAAPVLAQLAFLPPVDTAILPDRKALTERLQCEMEAAYAALPSRSR